MKNYIKVGDTDNEEFVVLRTVFHQFAFAAILSCTTIQFAKKGKKKERKKETEKNVKKRENWRVAAANLMGAVFKKLRFLILNFILPKSDVSYGICLIRKIQIGKSEFILDSCYQLFRCTNLKL